MFDRFRVHKSLAVVVLLLVSIFSLVPAAFATHTCDDNWWYAGANVIWCVHTEDGWEYWTNESSVQDLEEVTFSLYDASVDDLYTMGELPLVAMALHAGVDNTAVYAQLFVAPFDPSEYSSDEEVLEGISIGENRVVLDESSDGSVIGRAEEDYGDSVRAWTVYPFEELGEIYIVAAFAPDSLWNDTDSDLNNQLDDLLYSLQYYSEETNSGSSSSSSSNSNHPVWYGGEVLDIFQDQGNGSIERVFANAQWDFYSDGTVVFTPPGIGTELSQFLFPAEGTFVTNNANITFGDGRYSIEGGEIEFVIETAYQNTSVLIMGTLDVETGVAVIEYQASLSMIDSTNNLAGTNTYRAEFAQQLYQ